MRPHMCVSSSLVFYHTLVKKATVELRSRKFRMILVKNEPVYIHINVLFHNCIIYAQSSVNYTVLSSVYNNESVLSICS